MSSQLERLARPFPAKYVKAPASGKYGDYVPHHIVTQALLAILGPFDVHVGQVFYGENNMVEGCLVTLRAEVDGRSVSMTEVGDCEKPTNWKTQGARMKDAISDGVKRCAARLGCGLHLWAGSDYFLYDQLHASDGSAEADSDSVGRASGPEPVSAHRSTETGSPAGPSRGANSDPAATANAEGVTTSERPVSVPASVPPTPAGATGGSESDLPARTDSDPQTEWTVSASKLADLKAHVTALNAAGASVSMWRASANLPPLSDKLKPYEVQNWESLLADIEEFAQVSA